MIQTTIRQELSQENRAGRMLTAGRLEATVVSAATGNHISVFFKSRQRTDSGWKPASFADATHVFVTAGRGYGGDKVGTFYPRTGKFYEARGADHARVWAALRALEYAASGRLHPQLREITEAERCGRCGRRLTDPVSIARGIGPECATRETGSQHQVRGRITRVAPVSQEGGSTAVAIQTQLILAPQNGPTFSVEAYEGRAPYTHVTLADDLDDRDEAIAIARNAFTSGRVREAMVYDNNAELVAAFEH